MFETDEVVWVKPHRYPWWPAQVLHPDHWPKLKRRPPQVTCVKYLDEYSFEPVNNVKNIQPFLCPSRLDYQAVGLKCRYQAAFRKALDQALEIVGVSETESPSRSPDPSPVPSPIPSQLHPPGPQPSVPVGPPVDPYAWDEEPPYPPDQGENGLPTETGTGWSVTGHSCDPFQGAAVSWVGNRHRDCGSKAAEKPVCPLTQPFTSLAQGSGSYSCEFCGYVTTRLNNKVTHDKVCSPRRGKHAETGPNPDAGSAQLPGGCKRKLTKNDSKCKRGKRSRCDQSVKGDACLSATAAALACNAAGKLSKHGSLRKLEDAVQVRSNSKKALFQKRNRADPEQNGQPCSAVARRKGQRNFAGNVSDIKAVNMNGASQNGSRGQLSPVFRIPSESSLLLTPDPVKLEKMPPLTDLDVKSNSTAFDQNLKLDTCDSDSEEELPEGLTPIKADLKLTSGDLVWAQIKGWSYWPAVVRKFYPERKKVRLPAKVSLMFINDGVANATLRRKIFSLKCTNSRGHPVIFPFSCSQRAKFESAAQKSPDQGLIQEAITQVEDFLTKKGLGLIHTDALSFFFPHSPEPLDVDSEEELVMGLKRDRVFSVESPASVSSYEDPDKASDENIDQTQEDTDVSQALKTRNEQRKIRCENLVEFIKSDKMKEYLRSIYVGGKPSSLHSSFHGNQRERNKIRNPGFGPISDEEQRSEILETLLTWLREMAEPNAGNVDYAMDVWVPEAIVYALIMVKKYGRRRAWEVFHKGIRFTKEEYARAHHAIIEAARRISPQDRALYEGKLQQRMCQVMQSC